MLIPVRNLATLACAFFLVAPLLHPTATSAQDDRPGVGVLPIRNGGSFGDEPQDYERLQIGLQELLITELTLNSNLRIVERGQLRALMQEQEIPSDRVDAATAASLGRIVGARYMILGGFVDVQGTFRLDTRIVDTETTEVLDAARLEDDRDNLLSMVVEMARMITERADLPPLDREQEAHRPETRSSPQVDYRAVKLYSRAVELQDLGRPEDAKRMLESIVEEFPTFVQARQALETGSP
jgi:TolB-like protein